MAIVITEVVESDDADISLTQSTRTLKHTISGDEARANVEPAYQAFIPAFWQGLQLQQYQLAHKGGGVWEASAKYSSLIPKEIGQSVFTFDTTGATQKLKTSLNTAQSQSIRYITDEEKADAVIDFGRSINVQPDNKVEGVDVPVPNFTFTVQRIIADPLPTLYAAALEALTGKVNLDTVVLNVSGVIYTFAPGELRFEGATGTKRGTDAWEINLRCTVSRNATNLEFPIPGSTITGVPGIPDGTPDKIVVSKKFGWDYLWVWFEQGKVGFTQIPIPRQVNCEQVSYTAELSVLFAAL